MEPYYVGYILTVAYDNYEVPVYKLALTKDIHDKVTGFIKGNKVVCQYNSKPAKIQYSNDNIVIEVDGKLEHNISKENMFMNYNF